MEAKAHVFNGSPYPLGLPVDSNLDPVEDPIVTRDASGRFMSEFRGGILIEPID